MAVRPQVEGLAGSRLGVKQQCYPPHIVSYLAMATSQSTPYSATPHSVHRATSNARPAPCS